MSSDWWSRKLSPSSHPAPQQVSSRPPAGPPVRIGQQIRFPEVQERPQVHTATPELPPNAEINMGDALRMWKGGEATRKEGNMSCPECGSRNVFSRIARGANTTVQGNSPAPRCFECGWTGLYSQGQEANWA